MKTLCQTHHLFYSGTSCPLCNQERLEGYAHKLNREITENDIMKLMTKFNTNTKKH